jgi:hypothetical protein
MEAGLEAQARFNQSLLGSRTEAEIEKARSERLQTNVFNMFYTFLTGNPFFDPQSGKRKSVFAILAETKLT